MADDAVDLVVVGAGAGGMAAAITGALRGLRVAVLEKASVVGGTTALSAGSLWIPNSHHSPAGVDNVGNARRYLEATVGARLRPELCETFLARGPEMVRVFEQHTAVVLRAFPRHPDYLATAEGATLGGRVLEALPFDARQLGRDFRLLRDPLPEFTVLGGMMVDRVDIGHLLGATRSLDSFRHAARIVARHGMDRLRHHRGTRLVMGNALAGRLLLSLRRLGVDISTGVEVHRLRERDGRVTGIEYSDAAGRRRSRDTAAVVLATGGFSRDPVLREKLLPSPIPGHSPLVETATGDGVALARTQGARLGEGHADSSFWAPISVRQRSDGSTAVFPHFVLDRGKPGLIAVDSSGRRFVNEATTYHLFGRAMYAANARRPAIPCFFICDHPFVMRYGLGMVRPRGSNLASALKDGYVCRADSLDALASALAIEGEGLKASVDRNNACARDGIDPDFGKGSDAYQRNLGDPDHAPNPCLGPIATPPFYGLRVFPGDIGASVGIVTDAFARVLDGQDRPIPGLYACGNDMDSMMAGIYPGPGITIGPAMTFGYVAADHVARRNVAP